MATSPSLVEGRQHHRPGDTNLALLVISTPLYLARVLGEATYLSAPRAGGDEHAGRLDAWELLPSGYDNTLNAQSDELAPHELVAF